MSTIPISDIAPSEIPEGFTFADPTGSAAGGGAPSPSSNDAAAQREAQRQAILEQAMTPEALARLRRVKVCVYLLLLLLLLLQLFPCV